MSTAKFSPIYVYLYSDDRYKTSNNFEARYCILQRAVINLDRSITDREHPPFRMGGFEASVDYTKYMDRSAAYIIEEDNKDIISLIKGGLIEEGDRYDSSYFGNVQDSVLRSKGIGWFPPKMHRVEKIDYKKFGEQLQHINLKDPWKGTKNGNPKNLWFYSDIW